MTKNFALLVRASNWAGLEVRCTFSATADGNQLATDDPTAPRFAVPVGTTVVTVTATPKDPLYWESTVTLSITPGGDIAPDAGSKGIVQLLAAGGTTLTVAFANIQVSRFKDVTSDVFDLLKHPPSKRRFKTANGWVEQPVNELAEHQQTYGTWPPPDWDLHDVPDAHFLDVAAPVKAGALNFATDPSLKIEVDSVVLKLAGVKEPQLFAVTWPKAIAPQANATPTPFFIFIRQGNRGNRYDEIGLFVGGELGPYPNNFDYADTGLFQSMHYAETPFRQPGSKGVPYQVAKAGANVVTVLPCNSFEAEFGVLDQTEETGKILVELQAFMFWRAGVQVPPRAIGKTAIAAFSSGNYFLNKWLKNAANRNGNFLSNVVTAVYFLDPPTSEINGFITTALTWVGSSSEKRIRLYSRISTDAHKKLLGSTPPSAPYVANSADNKRSAGVLTLGSWKKTFKNLFGRDVDLEWQYAHHIIAATMLTHALAQGDF